MKKESARSLVAQNLLTAQLYVQNNLDKNLSLNVVAQKAGVSPSHFHRLFKARVGETLKTYVDRLRVEKSLYDIRITDLNLLQIAHRYGFKNPETFARVFKRHVGRVPSAFLKERAHIRNKSSGKPGITPDIQFGLRQKETNNFSITRLAELHLAFMRHVGPYEKVPLISDPGPTIWTKLAHFVHQNQLTSQQAIRIGIPQDKPGITAPDKLRYDACMVVDRPFQTRGSVGYQKIPAGYFGVITHAGPYATLSESYRSLFLLAHSLPGFKVDANVLFELLLDISATSIKDHTWTELYLPLKPRRIV